MAGQNQQNNINFSDQIKINSNINLNSKNMWPQSNKPHHLFSLIREKLSDLLSLWTEGTCFALVLFYCLGHTILPHLVENDPSAYKLKNQIQYSIKGSLIYCLGWIIVLTIHQRHGNNYMVLLKADNQEGYKRMVLLSTKLIIFYIVSTLIPVNHYSNRLLAGLLLYIWLGQKYLRTAIHYNFHSIVKKKMQFVNNFSMNQATSLVFIGAPLAEVLLPQLPWLPGFVTLFPILCRFTQCFVVGTHEQYLNSIKFTLNLIGFSYGIVNMPVHSHYWRIAAAFYSFYWDVFRDWKWKIRFIEKKDYRIDLPFIYFVLGFLYDLFGRTIWIIFPMKYHQRGIIEMTRRLFWDILRLEREQVFYFKKPQGNKVKDLFSS